MPTLERPIGQIEQERMRYLELAERLIRSRDLEEQNQLKAELARMTFGQ